MVWTNFEFFAKNQLLLKYNESKALCRIQTQSEVMHHGKFVSLRNSTIKKSFFLAYSGHFPIIKRCDKWFSNQKNEKKWHGH